MKSVILVEDRIYRQKNMLGEKVNEFKNFNFLKNISGGEDFAELKKQLLEKKYSVFDDYSTILIHRSAFDAEVRNGLMEYLNHYHKKLVLFSGGITGSQLNRLKNMELMLINVTEFYSENLLIFLRNNAENLLELAFGNNWKKSILVDAIERLTLYEKAFVSKKKPWETVEGDLKLNNAIIDEYFLELSRNIFIDKVEIGIVLKKMNADLKSIL
jgi:hypothetical protein